MCDTAAMTMVLIAVASYLAAAGWLVAAVRRDDDASRGWLLPANLAVLLHGAAHFLAWRHSGVTDLHFFAALSLVGLGMAALTASVGASGRMRALGVVVFPLAAMMLLAYALYGHATRPDPLDWRLLLHAWLALLAYATLAIAALLAIFLWVQERALRRREFHHWLRALPPLTELESLLFRTITVGFMLLTATLLTGVLICYLALYAVNLAWALFVLDPSVMTSSVGARIDYADLFVLSWFVASAATVGGGLGSGLESDDAVRAAAYSKREGERRNRLEDDRP